MSSPPWFRFYSETIHDAKLDRAALVAEVDRVVALGAWAGLLALSNESSVRGHLLLCDGIPFTIGELANKIGIDEQSLHRIIEGFVSVKMVHWEDDTLIINANEFFYFPRYYNTPEWKATRVIILERDNHTCQYCGMPASHVDHIVPVVQGGGDAEENLVAACRGCNLGKGGRTPGEAGMELLR